MPVRASEYYDESAGAFVCEFISRLPNTDTGRPFELYDWQRNAIMEFYGRQVADEDTGEYLRKYWYLYLEIPKKNGKSELAAALGIYHLFADGELNAEVYICAADKDNAGIVFSAAVFHADHGSLDSQDDRPGRAEHRGVPEAGGIPPASQNRERQIQVDHRGRDGRSLRGGIQQARLQAQLRDL
mgnify:CR=1 FL=1